MQSDFIEEFDTDDEDSSISLPNVNVRDQNSVTLAQFSNYGQGIHSHSQFPESVINYNDRLIPSLPSQAVSTNLLFHNYNHHYLFSQFPIQQNDHQPRKLKRNKKIQLIKLNNYSKEIRDFAWNDFLARKFKIEYQKLLKMQRADTDHSKKLNELKHECDVLLDQLKNRPDDLPDSQTLSLIAQKIKSQKHKRRRKELSPSELDSHMKELVQKNKEIDEWQLLEQKKLIETRENNKFKSEVKQTLREIRRKKRIVKEQKELLGTLSKLRNVRQKQNLNSKLNYKESPKEDRVFLAGVANLSESLDALLKEVESEETMLNFMLSEHKFKNKSTKPEEDETTIRLRKYEKRKSKQVKLSSDNYVTSLFVDWKNYVINPISFTNDPRVPYFHFISKKLGM